jgi:hypothetical protein
MSKKNNEGGQEEAAAHVDWGRDDSRFSPRAAAAAAE